MTEVKILVKKAVGVFLPVLKMVFLTESWIVKVKWLKFSKKIILGLIL